MRTGTGKGKNSREFEAFSRCPRTPGQTPTATELASPHTAGPQTPPITAEFLPVSFPSVLPPSVLRSSLHVSTDCTPRTGALVERLRSTTVFDLVSHYRERELDPDTVWKTHSTKVTYEGYLNKWILPRWEKYPLVRVNAGEVELWLRSLPLARSSCAKIRNLMSVVFNHGIRHEICDRNPIQLVRQSAKRKAVPVILSASEVQRLIAVLGIRERTLVLLAFGTGLRMSELFGLKWHDIDFQKNEISVTRSIVFQVVGPCKTEASQKPVPLDLRLAEALKVWREHTKYSKADDWVFASPAARGRKPYWGQCLMRTIIRPAAAKIGITQHTGWHTFRHTYSSLLRANKTDIKVTQELLRMRPVGSRWIRILRQSRHRSDEPKAASFVFSRRPQ